MRTEKNINNPLGLKGEELRKYRDAVETFEQSYASYSEAEVMETVPEGR